MKKNILFLLLLIVLSAGFVQAEETYRRGLEADLKIVCLSSNGYCNSAARCNATITYPNGTNAQDLAEFQNQNSFHNYTLTPSQTTELGQYSVRGFCKEGSTVQEVDYNFNVVPIGFEYKPEASTSQSILYGIGLIFLAGIFLLFLYFSIAIPWKPGFDMESGIRSHLRYIKLGFITLTYVIGIFLLAMGKAITGAFLQSNELYTFFNVAFTIGISFMVPLMIGMSVLVIFGIITDKKNEEIFTRGIPVR